MLEALPAPVSLSWWMADARLQAVFQHQVRCFSHSLRGHLGLLSILSEEINVVCQCGRQNWIFCNIWNRAWQADMTINDWMSVWETPYQSKELTSYLLRSNLFPFLSECLLAQPALWWVVCFLSRPSRLPLWKQHRGHILITPYLCALMNYAVE